MIQEGKKAPAFSLASSDGGTVSLKDFAGKNLVIYFYPKDDTPGCTRQAEGFRDVAAEFKKKGIAVVGISKDSIESHCKFRDKYALNFPLLSDPDGKVLEAYGAWGEKNMYGKKSMGVIRTTVLVGPDGTVRKVYPKVRVDGHVDKVVAYLDGAS